jgi:hypothetical protein
MVLIQVNSVCENIILCPTVVFVPYMYIDFILYMAAMPIAFFSSVLDCHLFLRVKFH